MNSINIIIAVLQLAFGAVLLWLSAVVVRENSGGRINRITALMLFFAGLGPIFAAVGSTVWPDHSFATASNPTFPINLVYVWELFFPQLVLFSMTFPVEHAWPARHSRLKLLIFLPHIVHIILMAFWTTPDFDWLLIRTDSQFLQTLLTPANLVLGLAAFSLSTIFKSHRALFSLVNLVYIVGAVVFVRFGYSKLQNPRLRDQVRILMAGIFSSMALYSVVFIGPAVGLYALPDAMHHVLFLLALFVGSTTIAWSIVRYQFLDIRVLARQSLAFTVSSALLVGGYLLLVTKVSGMIKDLLEIQSVLVDVAFVVLLLIVFQTLKDRIDDWITRIFLRSASDPRAVLETFSRTIAQSFRVEDVKSQVLDVVTNRLLVERAFLAVRETTGRFRLELAGLERETIAADDPLFTAAFQRSRPLVFEELILDRPISAGAEILSRWHCRLIVPIIDRDVLRMVLFLSDKITGARFSVDDINLMATLANQTAVALSNVELYQEALERQRLEEELNVARNIQLRLLPREPPQAPSLQLAAFSQPSRQVGGDYFDFFDLPENRLGLVIADVSGKGLGAALLVSQLQAILRSEVRIRRPIAEYLTSTNDQVNRITASDQFATLVYAEFDPVSRVLEYSNAGHNYPVVIHGDGRRSFLDRGGLILGAFAPTAYETGCITLAPSDTVVFFTDGLSDLRDRDGKDFGEERVYELVRSNCHLSAEALKNEMIREATEFSDGELGFDDLTMIVLKVVP